MRTIICSVAIVLLAHTLEARDRAHLKTRQHDESEWSIGVPRYVVGGIVGSTLGVALPLTALISTAVGKESPLVLSVLGSGFGHAIQGRWYHGHGWGFTMGGLYTFVALLAAIGEENNRAFAWTLFIGTKLGELISVWWPPRLSARAVARQEITTAGYVGGGLLGTVVGFGSGHLVQGRGIAGWPYTLTQVAALALASVDDKCRTDSKGKKTSCGMIDAPAVAGIVLFVISKLMETISVWDLSARDYKIVSPRADPHTPKLALIPLPYAGQPKLALQLTLAL